MYYEGIEFKKSALAAST